MEDFFDKVLHYYGRKGEKLFMINIGAMDGVLFDGMSGYADMYNSDVLYVEPMKPHFERLVKHKGGSSNNKFENSAISDYNGTIKMKTIPIEIVDQGLVHHAFYGMSVIDPTKNGMGSEGDREVVEKYAIDTVVNCITWDTLVKKHNIDHFDVISVDTEGHDYIIFNQIDLNKFKPRLIRLEWCNMSDAEKTNITKKLEDAGYVYEVLGNMDIDAIRKDVYDEIKATLEPEFKKIETPKSKLTIVTGLWNINRDGLTEGWSRTFQHYLDKFDQLLQIENNMIIFGDSELESFVFKKRTQENTLFVRRNLDWFKNNAYFEKIQNIRNNPSWLEQAGWLKDSTQAKLEYYNPLVMSKMFLLNDAVILDRFDSSHLFWIDAGITNTVHSGYFTHDKIQNKFKNVFNNFGFVAFPYDANNEIHGFSYPKINEYAGKDVKLVARGGLFGGSKHSISEMNGIYYNLLNQTLDDGYMGTEESLFSIIMHRYHSFVDYVEIDGNGLVCKFCEDLKNDKHIVKNLMPMQKNVIVKNIDIEKVGLYVISFNSPRQFETLIESMLEYDKDFIEKPRKFLLDNSVDLSTTPKYLELCEKYGFEHIKKDNIGICGGRVFIAEHFDQTDLSAYCFFEDDMQLYVNKEAICKSGFNRYCPNLYQKSLEIVKKENFDFLKLSFSEFYSTNSTQIAWYNTPQEYRVKHWPENPRLPVQGFDPNAPLTQFKNIKCHKGLPYATGEIFLCNWPIILTKEGNYKCYLETKFAHAFEQTLMSQAFQETIKGKINTGILLLSPIEHDRFHHYSAGLRKEN